MRTTLAGLILSSFPALAGDLRVTSKHVEIGERSIPADVGTLSVREDRAKEGSPEIALAFTRLKTAAKEPGPPVFFLPGVPAPATSQAASARWLPFLESRDVVLLDQRGTGDSRPRLTLDSPAFEPALLFGDQAGATKHIVDVCERAARDLRAAGTDPAAFNAMESADDIDALRAALGYEKIVVVGHSYGGHLGLEYVRRHPDRVARYVGLAPAGPDDVHKLPSEIDAGLRKLSALVREDESAGKRVPDLFALVEKVMVKLDAKPLTVTVVDPRTQSDVEVNVGRFGLQWILLRDLGDVRDLPVYPRLVWEVDQGKTDLLSWFVQKRYDQHLPLELAAWTMRATSGASTARWRRIVEEAKKSPFGTARCLFSPEIDAALALRDPGDAARASIESDVPALFVSGSLDANAPPEQAERIARGFPRGILLVVENAGHEDLLSHPESRKRVYDFIAGKNVEGGTVVAPKLRFVPVEGDAPRDAHPSLEPRRR
jgi:pimeloyl-ACP methyl ester carboxylesterase